MAFKKSWQIAIPLLFIAAALIGLALYGKKNNTYTFLDEKKIASDGGSLESYYQKAQSLRGPDANNTASVEFLAVGDISLSRNVAAAVKEKANASFPFLGMADLLKSTDFNFGNLESPVAPSGTRPIVGGHLLIFAAPADYIKSLGDYNFKIINLANNHAFDRGLAGINATRAALDDSKISYTGAGNNLEEAWQPAIVEKNGIKICFVGASYASVNDGGKTINNYVARIEDFKNLKLQITNSKSLCDFIVTTMHAGTEYTRKPNQSQIAFAHAAIDYGADVVIGAHPHWIQTIEKYQDKYIFYSLGNFIFDQDFSRETKEGLALKIILSKNVASATGGQQQGGQLPTLQGPKAPAKLDSIELLPIIITNSQPRPATADETKKILQKIGQTETILK